MKNTHLQEKFLCLQASDAPGGGQAMNASHSVNRRRKENGKTKTRVFRKRELKNSEGKSSLEGVGKRGKGGWQQFANGLAMGPGFILICGKLI